MARIRTIKPEFPEDETLGKVSRDARLTFVLLWTRCDDYGRFRAATPLLRGQLYPYDEDIRSAELEGWLAELVDVGRIHVYEVDGQRYGEVCNWAKHQRIDNASKSNLPESPSPNTPSPQSSANRGEPRRPAAGREGKGREGTSSSEGNGAAANVGEEDPATDHELAEEEEEEIHDDDTAWNEAKRLLANRDPKLPAVDNVKAWLRTTVEEIKSRPDLDGYKSLNASLAAMAQRFNVNQCSNEECVNGNVDTDAGFVACPTCKPHAQRATA